MKNFRLKIIFLFKIKQPECEFLRRKCYRFPNEKKRPIFLSDAFITAKKLNSLKVLFFQICFLARIRHIQTRFGNAAIRKFF